VPLYEARVHDAATVSEMGQSRRFDRSPTTSGVPRQADILRVIRHVAKVPGSGHFTPPSGA
jgi:hypothetical protein